ncbi:unnamed protein product [Camellia sinensis]
MQHNTGQFEEELKMTKEQLDMTQEERDRACDELREMKIVAQEANMNLSERLSSLMVEEANAEINTVKEFLSNSKKELNMKEENIESLKFELDKAKQFEVILAERDVSFDRLKEEFSNLKASEARAMGLLFESKKRIQELEDEIGRGNLSKTKMIDSVVSQTKQLEQTKIELEESKLEVVCLHEKIAKLKVSPRECKRDLGGACNHEDLDSTKEAFESLSSELQLMKENLARSQDSEKVASSKAKSLIEEMNLLKSELTLAIEAEEKSKKAMDDLALAIKEVATEAKQVKEKLGSTELELEHVKQEAEQLKVMVRSTEERYQKLLDEAKKENEQYKNTVERLRLEAEESLLAWNDKEIEFVNCIRRAEDDRTVAQEENTRLIESLKATENTITASREENFKLRDILKQALNEANVAKEAAAIAREENSQLKDSHAEKDEALDFLARENERLRINEAAAQQSIKELKWLLSVASAKEESKTEEDKEHGVIFKPASSTAEKIEDRKNLNKAFSFDLSELKFPIELEDVNEKVVDEDPVKAEALKGSIFDTVDSPMSEPHTPLHRRVSSLFTDDGEIIIHSEDLDHLEGAHLDDAEHDRNSQRKRKALLYRFGDLLKRKNLHKKEASVE